MDSASGDDSDDYPSSALNGTGADASSQASGHATKSLAPAQKRRRVTRACDECRRKKIKCDGKQPCTHCTVYSYECTYDQPSNRRRNPAPYMVEQLEARVHRAETLLRVVLPGIDLNDPSIDLALAQGKVPPPRDGLSLAHPRARGGTTLQIPSGEADRSEPSKDAELESMVKATGRLDLDDNGNWNYHGHSSGYNFLQRMKEMFGENIMGPASEATTVIKKHSPIYTSPKSVNSQDESPKDSNSVSVGTELPPREVALEYCCTALSDGLALLYVTHKPSFFKSFDRIYNLAPEDYTNQDHRFLPLLYTVLAVGCLCDKDEKDQKPGEDYEQGIDEGYKYFRAARMMMDITDCRDLTSLQAIVFMIMFLQSSAKLSTCYAYIGVALRSALRMGMHRSFSDSFTPIEAECRKRLFWVIRKLDIYVGALLGLPHVLSDEDVDQDLPTEVDDEYITEDGIQPMPEGQTSYMAASNAHTTLVTIIAKLVRYVYPIKSPHRTEHPGTTNVPKTHSYTVSHAKIREIEQDLQGWMEALPPDLKPGSDPPASILTSQQLLRMAYGHAQMLLYRPFLHYISPKHHVARLDKRSYACAAACVSVSRNIIHITGEMKRRGALKGAQWFTMYTTFFAILALVFVALEIQDDKMNLDVLKDAYEGKETLATLARRSMAADRCSVTLKALFDQLPPAVKNRPLSATFNKKRPAPDVANLHSTRSDPDLSRAIDAMKPQRAESFPLADLHVKSHNPATSQPSYKQERSSSRAPAGSSHSPFSRLAKDLYSTPQSPTMDLASPYGFGPSSGMNFSQQNRNGLNVTPGLPDLGLMMFPSADPFEYPNQPLSYLERPDAPDFLLPFNTGDTSLTPTSGCTPLDFGGMGEESDVQLYGPLPPYLAQGQQPGMNMDYNTGGPGQDNFIQGIQNQNPGLQGLNMDELFGGQEWNGGVAVDQWGR